MTEGTDLRTLLLPCYLQLLGWRCWGARLRRRICGRCCYHAICSCWGGGAGERDCGDESADGAVTMLFAAVESADGAVTMLFAAVGVQLLGSETEETNLRTVLLPCYLQLLGCRCLGARRRKRICGRCCYHAITMLFAAVGVQVLGSETGETNLRTVLLPCYYHAICSCWGGGAGERVQLLGCSCWGARRRKRICGRCCYHAICSCWGAGAGERDGGDESADAAVTMLFAAVGVEVLGSETAETNLRTVLLACYLQLLGVQVLGSETEETNLRTLLFPCYLQLLGCSCWGARLRRRICGRCCYLAICSCWGGGAGDRDCGDESADGAVTMLFAAVGVQVLGSETEETNLRTVLLPCYLQLLGCTCCGARRRKRICGRCCCHAICSCWGAGAGERDGGDESADGAVTMLFAAVGVQVLGSETEETNQTVLLPCYLQLLGCRCWGARRRRRICGRCMLPCYLQLLGCRCWGARRREARRRRRICGRCCYHAICSCWGAAAGERDGGDESADGAVAMLFAAAGERDCGDESADAAVTILFESVGVQLLHGERDCGDESADAAVAMLFAAAGVQLLGSETAETNLWTVLPCYLQLLGWRCWGARRRRRICGRCCCHAIFAAVGVEVLGSETEETNLRTVLLPWGAAAGERECELGIGVGGDGAADGGGGGCCCLNKRSL